MISAKPQRLFPATAREIELARTRRWASDHFFRDPPRHLHLHPSVMARMVLVGVCLNTSWDTRGTSCRGCRGHPWGLTKRGTRSVLSKDPLLEVLVDHHVLDFSVTWVLRHGDGPA